MAIDFDADILDTRDIIERLAELEAEDVELDEDEQEELEALVSLREQAEGQMEDWPHGETLIADHYFTEFAEQYASDMGAINGDAVWPINHIDWDEAAEDLKQDYSEYTLRGTTYWAR